MKINIIIAISLLVLFLSQISICSQAVISSKSPQENLDESAESETSYETSFTDPYKNYYPSSYNSGLNYEINIHSEYDWPAFTDTSLDYVVANSLSMVWYNEIDIKQFTFRITDQYGLTSFYRLFWLFSQIDSLEEIQIDSWNTQKQQTDELSGLELISYNYNLKTIILQFKKNRLHDGVLNSFYKLGEMTWLEEIYLKIHGRYIDPVKVQDLRNYLVSRLPTTTITIV